MAIRVFLNTWIEKPDGGGIHIEDPIDEYLRDISLSAPIVGHNYHARIAGNGRPDRVYNLKTIRGNLTQTEWDTLKALPGVRMLPPSRFDKPLSSVPKNLRNKIRNVLAELGIPETVYTSTSTIGGFLRNLQVELNDQVVGFGDYENIPDEWE